MLGFLHFRGFANINVFRTKQSVCNIVDGHFSGVSIGRGSTVFVKVFIESVLSNVSSVFVGIISSNMERLS